MLFVLSIFLCFHKLTSLVLFPHTAELTSKVLPVCSLTVLLRVKVPVISIPPFPRSKEPDLYSWENRKTFEGFVLTGAGHSAWFQPGSSMLLNFACA